MFYKQYIERNCGSLENSVHSNTEGADRQRKENAGEELSVEVSAKVIPEARTLNPEITVQTVVNRKCGLKIKDNITI